MINPSTPPPSSRIADRGTTLVIFDLDGTLIDSAPDLCTALGLALREFDLPAPDLPAARAMIGEGQRVLIERALRHAGGDPGLLEPVLLRFRHHYSAHLVELTRVYPGVDETLPRLSARLQRAVATNKPGVWARQIADRLGLSPHVGPVLGEDDVGRRKPDPLLLWTVCQRAGVAPAQALMVGDSAIDMRTAAAAGIPAVFCTYGYADPQTAAARGQVDGVAPLAVIERFADLLPLLPE